MKLVAGHAIDGVAPRIVYTVEEGLISRAQFYTTPVEALEATGLRE